MFDQNPSEVTEIQVASTEELNDVDNNPAGEMPAEDDTPEAQVADEASETEETPEDLGVNFSN